jgi:predicted SAM-dependent methyltransferase
MVRGELMLENKTEKRISNQRVSILNIGAGPRIKPLSIRDNPLSSYFLVNIDPTYSETFDNLAEIEQQHKFFELRLGDDNHEYFIKATWQEFIPFYRGYFDNIIMYRLLEHIPMTEVVYFIYMLSTILKIGGCVEGIVPNYKTLAKMLFQENVNSKDFEAHNILITTEMLNEPRDPHASIWTAERIGKFFKLEDRFIVDQIIPDYEFDGRDIYLKFLATRIR